MDPWQATVDRRLGALETDMQGIKDVLLTLKLDVAELKGKVSNLPTTVQLVGISVVSIFAAVLTTAGLVFTIARLMAH